jgi:hypothetical protein
LADREFRARNGVSGRLARAKRAQVGVKLNARPSSKAERT